MNKEIEKELLNRGYKEFAPSRIDHEGIESMYQKRFDDEVGKKYFITVHRWRDWKHPHTGELYDGGYEYTVQFTVSGKPVDMNCFSSWDDVEEVEEFYENLWQKNYFDYYEIWDGEERRVERGVAYGS